MHHLVSIYEKNQALIERFIISSLRKMGFKELTPETSHRLFETFANLELIYLCDDTLKQTTPNHFRDRDDDRQIGMDRTYLTTKTELEAGYCVSTPYISTATGRLCVTVIYKTDQGILFMDFRLQGLLERFDLLERNDRFKRFGRMAYAVIGGSLLFFGLFVVFYGFFIFGKYLFFSDPLSLDTVFKPVIALTLGLAVFDLGKTIIEEEVLPRPRQVREGFNAKTLMNFSVSIIIALLIEALLVVFKISINNYRDLPYAAALIGAISLLFLVFAVFIRLMRRETEKTS